MMVDGPLVPTTRLNCSLIEPVPWPTTGAAATKRSDFFQNSRRSPADVSALWVS